MKITKELLKRHSQGLCTDEEKKAVEEWFETYENPFGDETIFDRNKIDREGIWSKLSEITTGLQGKPNFGNTQTIPLYRSVARYAAAACILLMTFFGGRFSANTANASMVVDEATKDILSIYGGNRTEGRIAGNQFKVDFDGMIKLINGSLGSKVVQVGDTSFVLGSYQTYYLSGSSENPRLLNKNYLPNSNNQNEQLKGYFSILKTYN